MHHSVTGFWPSEQKAIDPNKKKKELLGESHFPPIHCEKEKSVGTGDFNKTVVYAAVICGMIRDHPDMLKLVGLYCAPTDFCMGRKDRRRMDIMWGAGGKKNALLDN